MEQNAEVWRPVKGYEGLYEVSNYGKVKSLPRNTTKGKILSIFLNNGYPQVILTKNGYKTPMVHRLLMEAFVPNPDGLPCVNHKDEDRTNNFVWVNPDGSIDPEKSNLEWCSYSQNLKWGGALNRMIETRNANGAYGAEKPVIQKSMEGSIIKVFKSVQEAARYLGKGNGAISNVCNGKRQSAYGFKWEFSN